MCTSHRSTQVNSALYPSAVAKSSTSFGWCKGWNVTSAGWQVTLYDPIWHVSSSSGVATSVSELLYPCYFIFYFTNWLELQLTLCCCCLYLSTSHSNNNDKVDEDDDSITTTKSVLVK